MYHQGRSRSRPTKGTTAKAVTEVPPYALQLSLQNSNSPVGDRQIKRQTPDFRLTREQVFQQQQQQQRPSEVHAAAFQQQRPSEVHAATLQQQRPSEMHRTAFPQPEMPSGSSFIKRPAPDFYADRQTSSTHFGGAYQRDREVYHHQAPPGQGGGRQVHRPSQAYATQITQLDPAAADTRGSTPLEDDDDDDMEEVVASTTTRMIHSAGAQQASRQYKGPVQYSGDRIMFAESPSAPGIPIVYRTPEDKAANPERLNLDRRRLCVCPILEGEDQLRLLNFQHNSITRIHHLSGLKRLIFLDLYDNQVEEIAGLTSLRSLRVLMLGKNRIKTIENLDTLGKLDVLDLHGNQIEVIENMNHLADLRVLNLAGNNIAAVHNLNGMDSLAELNLRRNKITTVTDVDNLPNLQRLFLSFNQITCFESIACLGESISLSELSLDGNPFPMADSNYKQIVLRHMAQLRQLDMKRITEEERRVATVMARKEEEKKKENTKMAIMKEKRRIAISNAARQWEVSQGISMAKTGRLQVAPSHHSTNLTGANPQDGAVSPTVDAQLGSEVNSGGVPEGGFDIKRKITLINDKGVTPDLLTNMPDDVCHLAELEGDVLHLYGPGSLEALDKNWGIQAAAAITSISFKFINFDGISKHLHKIRNRFPNVYMLIFGETNIDSLQQINALSVLRRLDSLTISSEGNPITAFTLWKPYTLFRLAQFSIRKLNNAEVTSADVLNAEKLFGPISAFTTSNLPPTRLLTLLNEGRRKQGQVLSDHELKARKQLMGGDTKSVEGLSKIGLQYGCEHLMDQVEQEREERRLFAGTYLQELTEQAAMVDKKQTNLQQMWPRLFVEMVQSAVVDMIDRDAYMARCMAELEGGGASQK